MKKKDLEGFEIHMYCDKHKQEWWLDSAVPVKKRDCPKCLKEKL